MKFRQVNKYVCNHAGAYKSTASVRKRNSSIKVGCNNSYTVEPQSSNETEETHPKVIAESTIPDAITTQLAKQAPLKFR